LIRILPFLERRLKEDELVGEYRTGVKMINTCKVSVGKPDGKIPRGR
jgi:hypothetical protein